MRLIAVLALCGLLLPACHEAPPDPRPNVLLITLDGLRRDHLPTFGYERETAPHIDALARRGLVFSRIVPSSCSTKVSLTSLLTGLDSDKHGVTENKARLPDRFVTLAETFRAQGYETAAFVGSPWILARMNYGQGFDLFEDFREKVRGGMVGAERLVGAAIETLDRHGSRGRPFFYYLHLKEPHPPWIHGSPWLEGEEPSTSFFDEGCGYIPTPEEVASLDDRKRRNLIAKYDGAILYADTWIGKLLDELRRLGLEDDTIVAISADHGLELMDRYSAGHGNTPYNEVLRGFLVIADGRGPLAAAGSLDAMGRLFDVGPTLLDLAGLEVPDGLDGRDLLGASDGRPELAFATCYSGEVARSRRYKLIRFDFRYFDAWGTNRIPGHDEGFELYDLEEDPGERRDVIAEHPDVARRLEDALAEFHAAPGGGGLTPERARSLDADTLERLRTMGYVR